MNPKAPPVIGTEWLTTPPLDERSQRGRVTIIVFWSAGCEASRARLLELQALRRHLPQSLTVVAVHSPRFAYERDTAVVEDAVARMHLKMPVVHDPALLTWARYSPGGWPAAVVVDHRGRAVGVSLGLDNLDPLHEAAELALLKAEEDHRKKTEYRKKTGRSKKTERLELPEPIVPTTNAPDGALAWPSSVALIPADANGGVRLAVADSGNDRVLVLALSGDVRRAHVTAAFSNIADLGRVCALSASTLAVSQPDLGQVSELDLAGGRTLLADGIERPQGLAVDVDGSLVIADAGDNQLLRIVRHPEPAIGVVAGSGFTGTDDGPAWRAELAQPVDVIRTPNGLAFLDAASSNLRLLTGDSVVRTVTNNGFEEFGLTDGPVHQARMQRPSGLAIDVDGIIYIADTGNNRIRCIGDRRVRTLGLAGLRQPEDLEVLPGGFLAVADTANHRLIMVDLASRAAWPLEIVGAENGQAS